MPFRKASFCLENNANSQILFLFSIGFEIFSILSTGPEQLYDFLFSILKDKLEYIPMWLNSLNASTKTRKYYFKFKW